MELINSLLGENALVSGGIFLMVAGYVLSYLKKIPVYLLMVTRRKLVNEVTIPDHDDSYEWVRKWASDKLKYRKFGIWRLNGEFKSETVHPYMNPMEDVYVEELGSKSDQKQIYSPDEGWHLIWHGLIPIIVEITRRMVDNSSDERGYFEEIRIVVIGIQRKFIEDLIDQCRDKYSDQGNNMCRVFYPSGSLGGSIWAKASLVHHRSFDSIFYNHKESLKRDVESFFRSKHWYRKVGIPYRRGYLFYGPPGNGKTSIARAIASEFGLSIYYLSLSSKNISDERLIDLIQTSRKPSLILIEDIDCLTQAASRDKPTEIHEKGVTLSGLLNALDGVCSSNEYVLVMTTNYKENIDPALLRPGRVDRQFEFCNATVDKAVEMYEYFTGSREGVERFIKDFPDGGCSMASLQEKFIESFDIVDEVYRG